MNQLKKVAAALYNTEIRRACDALGERLAQSGIEYEYRQIENQEQEKFIQYLGKHMGGAILWLTDDAVLAGWLAQRGEAVLFVLYPSCDEESACEAPYREKEIHQEGENPQEESACEAPYREKEIHQEGENPQEELAWKSTPQESASPSPQGFERVKYACEKPEELELSFLEGVFRRYKGLPWEICETERCFIRETTVEDVDAFYEIYREPSITRYMENLYEDPEEERTYIRDYIEKVYGLYDFGIWTVVLKESGAVIGRAGLNYREGFAEPELGFVIGRQWQGQGLAYEVCQAVLRYVRETFGFERIQALTEPENEVSVHLCEKLGFVMRERLVWKGTEYLRFLKEPAGTK